MRNGSPVSCHWTNLIVLAFVGLLTITAVPVSHAVPQTAATGALIGEVLDPTGQGIPGASVELKNQEMAASRSTVSDEEGRFVFTLLPPGTYQVTVQKDGYSQAKSAASVSVTETARLPIPLKIAGLTQSAEVHANVSGVQTDSSAMGRVVDGNMVTSLPLVTRNYTQIAVPKSCFTTPPVIGADGLGTAFENSGTGIVDGPGQVNVDLSL